MVHHCVIASLVSTLRWRQAPKKLFGILAAGEYFLHLSKRNKKKLKISINIIVGVHYALSISTKPVDFSIIFVRADDCYIGR